MELKVSYKSHLNTVRKSFKEMEILVFVRTWILKEKKKIFLVGKATQ